MKGMLTFYAVMIVGALIGAAFDSGLMCKIVQFLNLVVPVGVLLYVAARDPRGMLKGKTFGERFVRLISLRF